MDLGLHTLVLLGTALGDPTYYRYQSKRAVIREFGQREEDI